LKSEFNQPINNLPKNLTHLSLGYNFNQSISDLPLKLKEINIENCEHKEKIFEDLIEIIPAKCKIKK
jgi:hypothetical protein